LVVADKVQRHIAAGAVGNEDVYENPVPIRPAGFSKLYYVARTNNTTLVKTKIWVMGEEGIPITGYGNIQLNEAEGGMKDGRVSEWELSI
jgi:hypothetical protein